MHKDVPQWLVQAFVRSAQAAGSTESKEQLATACHHLIEAWSSDDRKYHGLHHVVELLTRVETLLPETGDPALVRLAAWFHGVCFSTSAEATYTNNGGENEEASALFAEAKLYELGVDPEKARRVATLIRSMRIKPTASPTETSRFQAIDIDEQALRDAHLGTLAVEPQKYKRYLELVREEYEHIPREDFLRARHAIITKLLARRQLFVTPLARQWDQSARENLAAELQRLNEALANHEPSEILKDETSASSAKPNAIDSLLSASENEEAAERAAAAKEAARLAQLQSEATSQLSRKDTLSSLESCADKFDPGVKESAALTPEQKRQRRREQIAEQMRQRIEERHRAADTARLQRVQEAERLQEAERATDTAELAPIAPGAHDVSHTERPEVVEEAAATDSPLPFAPVPPRHSAGSAPAPSAATADSPHRVSIWERLNDSPLSANTPEWIDDDPSDYHETRLRTDDLVRGIPHFTDDDDVKATGILDVPTHGIEKEPNL
ncbi:MAG: hypothetical protein QM705_11695 [Ancrocorticia sp.]